MRVTRGAVLFPSVAAALASSSPAAAQNLRDRIAEMFRYGTCAQPLCLDGSITAANGHGQHFIPAAVAGNATVISFIGQAVELSVSNVPLSAASGGTSFSFRGGVPVKTTESSGPVFGERAETLGKGRLFVGTNLTGYGFTTLRAAPLSDLALNFAHQDTPPAGLGDPLFENDVIETHTALDINLLVTSVFATYGLSDAIDIGVAVPFVRTSVSGRSTAQIVPFGQGTGSPPTAAHFFGGAPTSPQLSATGAMSGSAWGLGDVAARLKVNLNREQSARVAALAEVRVPTGDPDDFTGAGGTTARGLVILSGRFREFGPHANFGFLYHSGGALSSAIVGTAGFDQLLSPWATLAVDVLSQWQVGTGTLALPAPTHIVRPFVRTVVPTNIPDRRDDIVDASLGAKLHMDSGLTAVVNALVPVNRGGLRPSIAWTLGAEYNF